MKIQKTIRAAFIATSVVGGAALGVMGFNAAKDRVNEAYSEEVGSKPNLLARTYNNWLNNAPDFEKEPTLAGFINKHGKSFVEVPSHLKDGPSQ